MLPAIARWVSGAALLGCGLGCSAASPEPIVLRVTSGVGQPPFGGAAVARVQLRTRSIDGVETAVAAAPFSAGSIDVPPAAQTGVGSLVVAGLAADGKEVAYGRTPPIDLSGLPGAALPLVVLVDRPGIATPAVSLVTASATPRAAMVGARWLVVGDGASTDLHVVDLLTWSTHDEVAALDAAPITLASAGDVFLVVDAKGSGAILAVGSSGRSAAIAPAGTTFGDVVGGAVVVESSDAAWIVGGTRAVGATDVVMRLGSDGKLVARRLARARTGAGAAWIPGRGLVVVGGASPDGKTSPSVEIVATSATTSTGLPFPSDATVGAPLVALDGNALLRASPSGLVERFDLSCASACEPTPMPYTLSRVSPRADDAASLLEGGSLLFARGGVVTRVEPAGKTIDLVDGKGAMVSMTTLSTGAIAVVVGNDRRLRSIR